MIFKKKEWFKKFRGYRLEIISIKLVLVIYENFVLKKKDREENEEEEEERWVLCMN